MSFKRAVVFGLLSVGSISGQTQTPPPSPFVLGLVGVNATGSGSSAPLQQYFVAFDILTPFAWGRAKEKVYPLQHQWWVWGSPRIASLPSPNSSALNTISSASGLSTGAGSQTIGGITQSFEFQGGIEYMPHAWGERRLPSMAGTGQLRSRLSRAAGS